MTKREDRSFTIVDEKTGEQTTYGFPDTPLSRFTFGVLAANTIESFFALLKRSNYGIHHHMSRKYLGSYCAERDFVYNGRKISDDQRTDKALRGTSGKRLMLKQPKGVQLQ